MPAPEEQGYELPHVRMSDGDAAGIDPPMARDRPAAGSAEDLAQRQNRLLPGHPSSRFEDDGTPRPPLVPLKNLELPEPGEDREHNGAGREQAARNGWPGSGAENGQAERGAWADPPGKQAAGAPESVVTKPDVWASVDREIGASESVDPQQQAREPADQEQESTGWDEPATDEVKPDDQRDSQQHESPAQREELAGAEERTEDQPGRDADAEAADTEDADTADAGTADADTADAGTTAADTADAGTTAPDTAAADPADAQHGTLDDEPIADHPAPAGTTEAKRAEALTPEQVRIAVRAHGRCRLAEGRSVFGTYGESGLTPAMRRIEDELDHGTLVPDTEKYALKSLDRFQEKLAKQIARFPGADATDLADEIHDGVRYTFIFDADTYVDGIVDTRAKIEAEGYSLIEMKPSWHSDEYKGVNSRWRDNSSGSLFEVQLHTPASWEAKQKTHDAYEKIDRIGIPLEEVERLRAYQRAVCASVPVPPGSLEMRGYKKES
jgi:hypothetical protein